MLRFKITLLSFMLIVLSPAVLILNGAKAAAATTCGYSVCSKEDVKAGTYGLSDDHSQLKGIIGGIPVIFAGGNDANHTYTDNNKDDFCKASQISFSGTHWTEKPRKGTFSGYTLNNNGACDNTTFNIQVSDTWPPDPPATGGSSGSSSGGSGSGDSGPGSGDSSGSVDSSGSGIGGSGGASVSAGGCGVNGVANNKSAFFFLPHWWEFMKSFKPDALGQCMPDFVFPDSLFPVGLAVVDILLRIAGFAAVIAVMISGIMYMSGQGNPDRGSAARKALFNALIGLGIVFTASLAVAFIGNKLVG